MGWSIETIRVSLLEVFGERKFRVVHPQSIYPTMDIMYSAENKLSNRTTKYIVALFPESVYVNFVPLDGPENTYTWDN
jgi:hypothetical protein